jgi:hypothetical protein
MWRSIFTADALRFDEDIGARLTVAPCRLPRAVRQYEGSAPAAVMHTAGSLHYADDTFSLSIHLTNTPFSPLLTMHLTTRAMALIDSCISAKSASSARAESRACLIASSVLCIVNGQHSNDRHHHAYAGAASVCEVERISLPRAVEWCGVCFLYRINQNSSKAGKMAVDHKLPMRICSEPIDGGRRRGGRL